MIKKNLKSLWGMVVSATARDSATFFIGNLLNTTLSFIAVLIVSRHLGPEKFGVLGVFNSIIVIIIALTDLGLNTTSIRLISEYRNEDPSRAAVLMNVIVRLELLIGLVILLVGLVFSPLIASALGGERYLVAVRLGFIAGAFASAAAFFGPFFVSYRLYLKNALLNLSSFLLKIGLVLILLLTSQLTLTRIMVVYTAVPILFFVVGLFFIPHDFLQKSTKLLRSKAFNEIFHYSKWIFLSLLATGAISRLDILILAKYHGGATTGYYYAAQQLIAIMPLVILTLNTVLLQRISQLEISTYQRFLKNAFIGIVGLAVVLLPALFVAPWGFRIIFGDAYINAAGPFRLLFLSQLITLLTIPLTVWLLKRGEPKKISIATGGQFVVSMVLYLILIPRYSLIGAGMSVLFGSVTAAIILLGFSGRYLNSDLSKAMVK